MSENGAGTYATLDTRAPSRLSGVLLIVASLFLNAEQLAAGPITFNTALPVAQGEFILREQVQVLRSTDDPSLANSDLRVLAVPSVLAYGVTRDFTLFGIVPYLDKTIDFTSTAGRQRRGASGPGDSTVLGRYTIYSRDRLGETIRVAPFLGLKIPTGEDTKQDSLGRLPQPLQLGSGSWDPLVGTTFTWLTSNRYPAILPLGAERQHGEVLQAFSARVPVGFNAHAADKTDHSVRLIEHVRCERTQTLWVHGLLDQPCEDASGCSQSQAGSHRHDP